MEVPAEHEWSGRWWFVTAVVALCWVLSILSILSWLILPIALSALGRTSYRGAWLPFGFLLLASPMGFFFIDGMLDYAKGAPKLHSMGLPSLASYNIDPRTRSFYQTGGCLVDGDEWVSQDCHNLGVLTLGTLFGPPSRSYGGPYPTKEQAMRLSSSAPVIDDSDFLKGKIPLGGGILEMSPDHIRKIAEDLRFYSLGYDEDPDPSLIHIRATVFEKRCLILRLVEQDSFPTPTKSDDRDFIILIDRKNMRPFAYYRITGNSATRCPRLQYLPELSR